MLTLEEMLKEREERLGKDHPAVQMLRNQILAARTGKTFQELYTGAASAVSKTPVEAGLTPLPMDGRSPRGFRVDDELLPVFERVKRGLTSKRKTKLFHVAVADLLARVDESVIYEVGDRVGDGLPLHYIQTYVSDQGMLEMLGIGEDELKRATKEKKAKFARETLKSLQSSTDADICPGFWLIPITDGQSVFYLGYSITGYSFSGIEWKDEGAFLTEEDFVSHVCCQREMLFEDHLCVKGKATSVDQLSDSTLLQHIWKG